MTVNHEGLVCQSAGSPPSKPHRDGVWILDMLFKSIYCKAVFWPPVCIRMQISKDRKRDRLTFRKEIMQPSRNAACPFFIE